MWQPAETGVVEQDTETAFLLKMCSVVGRLIDEERNALQVISVDITAAAVANYYVNVAVANAALRAHAAVHRLLDPRVPPPHPGAVVSTKWSSVVDRLPGDCGLDLRSLAEVLQAKIIARCDVGRSAFCGRLPRNSATQQKLHV